GRRQRKGGFLKENYTKDRHTQHNRQRGRYCCQTHVRPPTLNICRNCATFFPSFPNFMLGKRTKKRSYLTSFSNAISVPVKRHTATFGSSIAANPRVMEFWNFAVTSLSPTFAGRDATRSRL